jgi:hypothetical protein
MLLYMLRYGLTWVFFRHLYLSGVWLGVDLRTESRKTLCLKEIGLSAENLLTILHSTVNITGGTYTMTHELENLHFDSE